MSSDEFEIVKVIVKEAGSTGEGLYARRDINPSEIIETVPIIEFCPSVSRHLVEYDCGEKFLAWRKDEKGNVASAAVACGLLMKCNHSDDPNAVLERNFEKNRISLRAVRLIRKNQEILLSYHMKKTFT